MTQLKTMLEVRQTTNIYPDGLDIFEGDKRAIQNWFDMRYVCDNEKFVAFFQRVLMRDYGLYRELLRTEPHISKYDWLVQQYTESQTYEKGSDTTTSNGQTTNTGTVNTATGQTTSNTDTTNSAGNSSHTRTTNDTDTKTRTGTTTNSGTDTTTTTTTDQNTTVSTSQSGGSDTVSDGSHDNQKGLTRENPMSISYSGSGVSIDGNDNTGSLEWKSPTNQTETDTRHTGNTTTNYGKNDSSNVTGNGTQTVNGSTVHGLTTGTNDTETGTHTANDLDTDTTSNTTQTVSTGSVSGSGTTESENQTVTGSASNTNKQNLTQHINTGRSIDTATLLSQAQAFIMNSSAFQWLYSRLDPCFMGVYNDDNNYDI